MNQGPRSPEASEAALGPWKKGQPEQQPIENSVLGKELEKDLTPALVCILAHLAFCEVLSKNFLRAFEVCAYGTIIHFYNIGRFADLDKMDRIYFQFVEVLCGGYFLQPGS